MISIVLPGENTSALGVLAPVGLASILDEAGLGPATFCWSVDSVPSRAVVSSSAASAEAVAEAVRAHAARHCRSDSWLQATIVELANHGRALFSPRSTVDPSQWPEYLRQREAFLSRSILTNLDWGLLSALGEPAWWQSTPDMGASLWDMHLRASGREIVSDRFRGIARAVSDRSVALVLEGLLGEKIEDECGDNKSNSQTPNGLTPPNITDNALAWVALWGLSAMPVFPVLGASGPRFGLSQTPGMFPRRDRKPEWAALPIVGRSHTCGSLRGILISLAFDAVAFGPEGGAIAERAWLAEQGLVALLRCEVHKTPVKNPQLYLRFGTLDVL